MFLSPTLRRASVKSWVATGTGSLNISYNTSNKPFCRANYMRAIRHTVDAAQTTFASAQKKSTSNISMLGCVTQYSNYWRIFIIVPWSHRKQKDNITCYLSIFKDTVSELWYSNQTRLKNRKKPCFLNILYSTLKIEDKLLCSSRCVGVQAVDHRNEWERNTKAIKCRLLRQHFYRKVIDQLTSS